MKAKIRKTYFQRLNTWLWLIIFCILLMLFVIGTFFDYQIAAKLYDDDNLFGITFDYFGRIAFLIPFNFASISLITHYRVNNKKQIFAFNLIYLLYFVIATVGPLLWIGESMLRNIDKLNLYVLVLIPIVYLGFLIFELIYIIREPAWLIEDEHVVSKIILSFFLIAVFMLWTEVVKNVFSRPRPIDVFGGIYEYHEWWRIDYHNGFGINKSFPSGHVASAMCLIIPAIVFQRSSKEWYLAWFVALFFVILVAISRMILGAHYLTDVSASVVFCLAWLFLGTKIKEYFIEEPHE